MALPGIAKVREQAREADEHVDLADRALTNLMRSIAAAHTDAQGNVTGRLTHEERTIIQSATETLVAWEAKANALWDEVSFMEDT